MTDSCCVCLSQLWFFFFWLAVKMCSTATGVIILFVHAAVSSSVSDSHLDWINVRTLSSTCGHISLMHFPICQNSLYGTISFILLNIFVELLFMILYFGLDCVFVKNKEILKILHLSILDLSFCHIYTKYFKFW